MRNTTRTGKPRKGKLDGKPTLLVLARAEDETAEAFATFARASGADVTLVDLNDLQVRLTMTRAGDATLSITRDGEPIAVRAILNRAFASYPLETTERFQAAESLAAWWAALALFPGRVANRPNSRTFQPELDASVLARQAGLGAARRTLSTQPVAGRRVNVHRVHDGTHVGFRAESSRLAPEAGQVWRFTEFDPGFAMFAVLSGERLLPLGVVDSALVSPLERLRKAILEHGANYALIVLERTGDVARLVHASPFLSLSHYRGQEEAVHGALLDYLSTP